jgi:cardiolipin synthase (CMP-forming)
VKRSHTTISIPNILTLARILLTPLFVILLLKHMLWQALLVFAFAGISDALDGFIARYFNQRTVLGAYLDPVADKLLLISAFVCLAVLGLLPSWLTVIVITRDVIIVLGIAILALTEKKYEVKPSIISKFTTAAQLFTVFLTLLHPYLAGIAAVRVVLYWLTAVLTTLSGLHYIYLGMQRLQEPSGDSAKHQP